MTAAQTSVPIVFPDVELWAADCLQASLPDHGYVDDAAATVSNRRENDAIAVWLRRDGGPVTDHVREIARLGVNVFAPDEQQATQLALVVSTLLRAGADGQSVVRVRQTSGPSPVPDASGPRRYMTFEITTRGTEL